MKFTTTTNITYRSGIGDVSKPWIDYGFDDHKKSIWKYFKKNIKLYDWDSAGNETHDFVFEDGKAYRLEYSWWSEWYHEDDDRNGPRDKVNITEISIDDANVMNKYTVRDWL
jgi:hypothetical protein